MPDPVDRRVRRSRTALMAAAVRLASERGTTAMPVSDIADAADVSRQLVYLQFGDRDALFVAAAADLVERELLPEARDAAASYRARALATTRHFARYRAFYRAMLTGSCAFEMTQTLNALFGSLVTADGVRGVFGAMDDVTARDLATVISSGTGAVVNEWVIEADDPLDPERLADRLSALMTVLARDGDR